MATESDTTESASVEADVQPIYVAIDCSKSMNSDAGDGLTLIDLANQIPARVHSTIEADRGLADSVRVGIVTFGERAEVVVPLGDLSALGSAPRFPALGDRTAYGELFALLESEIITAVEALRADNAKPRRPIVFVITDGEPNDSASDRDHAFDALTKLGHLSPSIVMMGFKNATEATLNKYKLQHGVAILFSDATDAGAQLEKLIKGLVGTIIGIGSGVGDGTVAPGEVNVGALLLDSIDDSDWDDDDDDPYK